VPEPPAPGATGAANAAAARATPAIEAQVRLAQAQMTFDRSTASNFLGGPVGLLITWALWGTVNHTLLVAWVVAKFGVMGLRLAIIRRNRQDGPARTLHWMRRYEVALFIDGALYGLLATVLQPSHPPLLGMAMLATVVAVGAVGLVVLSTNLRPTLAFTLPVLLPAAVVQTFSGEPIAVYTGLGMFIFLGLVVGEGRRAAEHTRSMLRLRFTMDELAREREQALRQAEHSSAAKDRFIATISHEVRTPLHGILGLTRLLQDDASDGSAVTPDTSGTAADRADRGGDATAGARRRRAERLRTIQRSGEHLLSIINDVLDHSRIEGDRMRLYDEPFELITLVGEAVELQRAAAQEKGLYLSWLADMPPPRWVRGDAARVRQILLNLLSNAVKFTEQGGIELRVAHTSEGLLQVELSDSGPGVPMAERERIFEPFEQLDGSFARRHGGTGLGLTISRQLARAMQGDIECGTSAAGGALFRLWLMLPACEPAGPDTAAAAAHASATAALVAPVPPPPALPTSAVSSAASSSAPTVAPTAAPTAPPNAAPAPAPLNGTVLLVEDNAVNAIVAEAGLRRLGLQVTTVGDGHAAVAACELRRYDLILMDCHLPGLDGFEATRRIRAEEQRRAYPAMPIVALTANALAGDRERCLAAGMDDHLAKPFTEDDLRTVLRTHLVA